MSVERPIIVRIVVNLSNLIVYYVRGTFPIICNEINIIYIIGGMQ